jgi:hypothetical protein
MFQSLAKLKAAVARAAPPGEGWQIAGDQRGDAVVYIKQLKAWHTPSVVEITDELTLSSGANSRPRASLLTAAAAREEG